LRFWEDIKGGHINHYSLKSINDSSYSISGSALIALGAIDTLTALNMARSLSGQQVKGQLADAVTNVLFTYPG